MTQHPCAGMGGAAIVAFEQIATGVPLPPTEKGVITKLEARRLIQRCSPKRLADALGNYEIPQYSVPLAVHMQWCQWCSEQPEVTTGA